MTSPYPDEQCHLDQAYATLDDKLTKTSAALEGTDRSHISHAQNRLENEAMQQELASRLSALEAAERKLCFGRLDRTQGDSLYVGRIGLRDDDSKILQIDWRAPAAAPFYQASSSNPLGIARRRHITSEQRKVTALYDDVFNYDLVDEASLAGDSILLAALNRKRTGKMGDIVETIQAEQDAIIRSQAPGILVVQGGPGTGKTVVALHRAAHLLYRDRVNLERKGILVIGPSSRFLSYIDNVLPALGETGVVLATIGDLYPDVTITGNDSVAAARVKGDLRIPELLGNAVQQIRRTPSNGLTLNFGKENVHLSAQTIQDATQRAFSHETQHNQARARFLKILITKAANQLGQLRELDITDPYELDELREEVRDSVDARRELNLLWMPRTPEQLLGQLFTNRSQLEKANAGLFNSTELNALYRATQHWSEHDAPLLDELAEHLGSWVDVSKIQHLTAELDFASQAAAGTGVDARDILQRYHGHSISGTISERALADREWVYGHAIIDEAQELSPMAWRMLARRVPSKSMTVVGDLLQASSPAAVTTWSQALDAIAPGRWHTVSLTINYRTPATIVALAERVMAAHGVEISTIAVREGDNEPEIIHHSDPLTAFTSFINRTDVVARTGLSVVVAPVQLHNRLRDLLPSEIAILTANQTKGLEFDNVIILDPSGILATESLASLYVALTRATQNITVIASELPPGFLS